MGVGGCAQEPIRPHHRDTWCEIRNPNWDLFRIWGFGFRIFELRPYESGKIALGE
jgi:hypothetical protein